MKTKVPRLVITTSLKATSDVHREAARFSEQARLQFMHRKGGSIAAVLQNADVALVFSNAGRHLHTTDGQLKFHLGTAYIRLLSLRRGDGDPLVRAGSLKAGDTVLDTTFGLGRDSIVAAQAVGPSGRITAFESSAPLYYLAHAGLAAEANRTSQTSKMIDPITMAKIELRPGDSREFLALCPDRSFDIVLVDPMFSIPKTSDPGFALLRAVADPAPLSRSWIVQAKRVARRYVVLKTAESCPWYAAEGFQRVKSPSNATWYRAPGTPPAEQE